MNRERIPINFTADDVEHTIRFLIPQSTEGGLKERVMRDLQRLQWISIGHGYDQTPDAWIGKYMPEEYISVIRYLEKFGWERLSTNP